MKKIVVKLDLPDNKAKQKAMKTVTTLSGIDSISMDMKGKKLTVIGAVDPIGIVTKLRKYWPATDIILVGPAKEPEKPAEKEDGKKDEPKKEGGGGDDEQRKEEAKKEGDGKKEEEENGKEGAVGVYDPMHEMVKAYRAYNPQMPSSYYYVQSMEENPNACVLC